MRHYVFISKYSLFFQMLRLTAGTSNLRVLSTTAAAAQKAEMEDVPKTATQSPVFSHNEWDPLEVCPNLIDHTHSWVMCGF